METMFGQWPTGRLDPHWSHAYVLIALCACALSYWHWMRLGSTSKLCTTFEIHELEYRGRGILDEQDVEGITDLL